MYISQHAYHVFKLFAYTCFLVEVPGTLYMHWSLGREAKRQGTDISLFSNNDSVESHAFWLEMSRVTIFPPYFAAKRIWYDFTHWVVGTHNKGNGRSLNQNGYRK